MAEQEYTPTEARVRDCYRLGYIGGVSAETDAEFCRWLAAHDAEIIAQHEAARPLDDSVVFAPNVRNAGAPHSRTEDFTEAQWHEYAIGDTGTSYRLPGRLYVVQCEWCPLTFAAHTKVEAMALFRAHEEEMLNA